ncbi:DUF3667 domain-containing protein [Luteimonas sp. SX5]|uniref:DUF3667 domain-containing protein n=1 Tax=Luteimonas galliterrae TaxID=2940486 RepID=A0ABT0MJ95_9GAMM|nr:DUF3667 domain-containing protein [Luteimonas galliterrae]MCL1634967.1 DUF3667 domain-containing protein [Luteimonas galliterrae]
MTENNETAVPHAPAAAPARECENCGRALLGDYCYACGQPVKGLVRHFSSIIGDFADSVLNLDTRLPRTLWPLLAKPGFLTTEYFAGRRVRYVSPVRLFVFLSIVTFFVAQFTVSFGDGTVKFEDDGDSISRATTVQEVEKIRDQALAQMAEARNNVAGVPGADTGIRMGEKELRKKAQRRIEALRKAQAGSAGPSGAAAEAEGAAATTAPADSATATSAAAPTTPAKATAATNDEDEEDFDISFNGEPWDAKTNPIAVAWLPRFANDWLNSQAGRAKANFKRLKEDPNALKDAMLSAVPSTLFILLPLFALMLKILYVFKRRLYMEHLIVALHSHAFLCLALLLMFVIIALQNWLAPESGALHSLFGWIEGLLWLWMPVYLLVMQKRVYAQGWPMTLVKYCVLGFCYFLLLTTGAAFTMLFSLVNM